MGKFRDLTGQRFGRLTVIERAENKYTAGGNSKVMWRCRCDCDREVTVNSGQLLHGGTKSCGCYNRDIARERMKKMRYKRNEYDLSGDIGIGYTSASHEPFYFDKEFYDKIKDYCWNKHHTGYICAYDPQIIDKKKAIYLHKLIMNCQYAGRSQLVDHINGNKEDCRKCNLRYATAQQNNRNHKLQKNNTSGYSGLQWKKDKKIWEVYVSLYHKRIYIGSSKNYDEAIHLRQEAEKKYYGEWVRDPNADVIKQEELHNG